MTDPDKRIKQAVEDSIEILAEHIDPRTKQNCEATIEQLTETLDNDEVKEAIEASDEVASNKRKEASDGGRSEEPRPSGPQPDQHKRRMGA